MQFEIAKTILQLGTGMDPIGNAVNHDLRKHSPHIDVAHDLNVLPWPWPDNSFDEIVARAVLEHLRINLIESFGECWRILRPCGTLFVKLPHWQHDVSWQDPTHYWMCSIRTLEVFDPDTERGKQYAFYTDRKWRFLPVAAGEKPGCKLNTAGSSVLAKLEVRK